MTGSGTPPGGALSRAEAHEFAERWLPAWTGNRPEQLAAFYAPDAFYRDPAVPAGITGRDRLLGYFRRAARRLPGVANGANGTPPRWREAS